MNYVIQTISDCNRGPDKAPLDGRGGNGQQDRGNIEIEENYNQSLNQ